MKLASTFDLNGEHFSLHMVSSPLMQPFVYHVCSPSREVQKRVHHISSTPIVATIYDGSIKLDNVPSEYTDMVDALKIAIKFSLIGQ